MKPAEVFNLESDEDSIIDDSHNTVQSGILQESDREVDISEINMDSDAEVQEGAVLISQ